ncbi:hypothetical protein [Streptomyces griseoflavus]|uniref:hypothetical protein n=1 Tax=Streptomyces griseoflavus TaxID=35619 RepID=UPI00167CEB56|nr:hypothetical protein [Streptomyces griseoflavus]GGV13763.1 membrane protein [Streptomyces griseoflavus]
MSTTRHHINRQRRRRARDTRPAAVSPESTGRRTRAGDDAVRSPSGSPDGDRTADRKPAVPRTSREPAGAPGARPRRRRPVVLLVLCALTVLLGGFAGWAHAKAEALRDEPARRNTALTDLARTSEIKGRTAEAVDRLFSYDHTDPGALDKAARDLLTGKAVDQHRALLADVRERADAQKAVITTVVTESAVERIDGARARVLVYADQSSVATAGGEAAGGKAAEQDTGVYAGALLAVDVVHREGRWLVSGIDTFGR